jgi:micrococcal nuclease
LRIRSRHALVWAAVIGLAGLLTHDRSPRLASTEFIVRRVIDGDTIELGDGRLVRYIGIDAPEVRRKVGERWVVDPEPLARAATEANRQLVEGKAIRLEYDVQPEDQYGRVLAYVYVGERMVNEALLASGYAQLLTIPPNVRYVERFRAAVHEARRAHRGLWAER